MNEKTICKLPSKRRRLAVLALAAGVGAIWPGQRGWAGLVTFDDLPPEGADIPSGYRSLSWFNFGALDGLNYERNPSGYQAGVVSPNEVAYNKFGALAEIRKSDGNPFSVSSLYLTAAWNDDLTVVVRGFNATSGGSAVYTSTLHPSATAPTSFALGFANIKRLEFSSSGGTPHPGYTGVPATHFALDNLAIIGGGNWMGTADGVDGIAGAGGNWNVDGNWGAGFDPLSTDDASFNLDNTYTVSFSAAAFAKDLHVTAGTVTMNLSARSLAASGRLNVEGIGSPTAKLTLNGTAGASHSSSFFNIGADNGNGVLVIDGISASTSSAGGNFIGGTGHNGQVVLQNGATVTMASTLSVADSGINFSTGTLEISSNSHLTVPSMRTASRAGTFTGQRAEVTVDHAGLSVTGDLTIAGRPDAAGGGRGTFTIQNNGSVTVGGLTKLWTFGTLLLNGGTLTTGTLDTNGAPSHFTWGANGGTLNITNAAFNVGPGATAPLGSSVSIVGGQAILAQSLDVETSSGNGSITVNGGWLEQTGTTGFTAVGGGGNNGQITLTNSATFISAATVTVCSSGSPASTGTLTVQSGSHVTAPSLTITQRSVASTLQAASVLVDNAQMTIAGNLIAAGTISGAGNGKGTLTIQNGGSVTVGGTTKIWSTGTVILNSGGRLSTGSLDTGGNSSRFGWNGGLLEVSGPTGLVLGPGGQIGPSLVLASSPSRNLIVSQKLSITSGGTLELSGKGVVVGAGDVTVGTLDTGGDPSRFIWNTGRLGITGPAGLEIGPQGPIGSSITLNSNRPLFVTQKLKVASGATLELAPGAGAVLSVGAIEADALTLPGATQAYISRSSTQVSVLKTLSIASGAAALSMDGKLVLDYSGTSPFSEIRQHIVSGYEDGQWQGIGIRSEVAAIDSFANPDAPTAVGYAEQSSLGINSYFGQPLDATSMVLAFTYAGDANLDLTVNALDFNALASNFGAANRFWAQGDFNYDGAVNMLDFNLVGLNFNRVLQLGPALAPQASAPSAVLVPEPGMAGLVALALGSLKRTRRF